MVKKNQQFKLKLIATDIYEIIPVYASNMRLDVDNANPENNAQIHIYSSNSTNAQRFKILPTGNGDDSFKILTAVSNYSKCVTVANASMQDADIIQYTYYNNGNQDYDHWYFEEITLNEKQLVTLSAGERKTFEFTVPDNKYYVVETSKYAGTSVDTCLFNHKQLVYWKSLR